MRKILLLIALAFYAISCQNSNTFETINVKDYSVDIPTNLSKTENLNKEASLQYQNLLKELYIIVIDESKKQVEKAIKDNGLDQMYSNDFKGYVELMSTNFNNLIGVKNKTQKDTLINSLETKIVKFEAKLEEYDIFYEIAYVNGIENYYQIMTWTLLSKKEDHEEAMDKMIYSFKINNSKKYIKSAKKG